MTQVEPIIFELRESEEFIHLCDLLKVTGLCQTGGHAKIVIDNEEVLLDGEVETRKRKKVYAGQVVEFEGQMIKVSN